DQRDAFERYPYLALANDLEQDVERSLEVARKALDPVEGHGPTRHQVSPRAVAVHQYFPQDEVAGPNGGVQRQGDEGPEWSVGTTRGINVTRRL
uniref:hypothetical protein n=1 Tax=Marinobacter nauticus TaxID=2743 RepID=UPI0032B11E55